VGVAIKPPDCSMISMTDALQNVQTKKLNVKSPLQIAKITHLRLVGRDD
jgi:hypothetical protein